MSRLKTIVTSLTYGKKNDSKFYSTSTNATPILGHIDVSTPEIPHARAIQNFCLVWLDSNIDEISNNDCINSIAKLRQTVNSVQTFTDVDKCVDFIADIEDEKIFVILSGTLGQTIVPIIHDITQINSIYIFCQNKAHHEQWAKKWTKVNDVFTNITLICEALQQTAQDCDQNVISMSFVQAINGESNSSIDPLEQSFMYTQILKELLLTIEFTQEHFQDFLTYCRDELLVGNSAELTNVDKIERDYRNHPPLWWYTYDCFLQSMLHRALRTMEVDLIIKLGFFLRDLHQHITQLHSAQYSKHHDFNTFMVYRGQGLSQTDFDQLKKTQGGLLAFNNFIFTNKNRNVSLAFARRTVATSDLIGVLFAMKIDSTIPSTFFANIQDVSAHSKKDEIIFSMNSIFRIDQIKQIDELNNHLWQVELILTNDADPKLHRLTKHVRQEILSNPKGWYPLGSLSMKFSQFSKAQKVFEIILNYKTEHNETAYIYHSLGNIKNIREKYEEAIEFYKKSIEFTAKKHFGPHPDFATSYDGLGFAYNQLCMYLEALTSYKQALKIYQTTFPSTHPFVPCTYQNIGKVYNSMGEYSNALLYYDKALEIYQNILPSDHLILMRSYNHIGEVYDKMGEYVKALSYYANALEICQKTLPSTHPDLASYHNNIGGIYDSMGKYSNALSSYEQALTIYEQTLPLTHPYLASSYNNVGRVYDNMGEYSKALSYHEKDLEICEKNLPADHPNLACCYGNIGGVYDNMGEYSKALWYYQKDLEICENTLPSTDPDLACSYNNIGRVYDNMGEYSKALSYHEKALKIYQESLSPAPSDLACSLNNIGLVYNKLGQYSQALSYHEKVIEIRQSILSLDHPLLAQSYNNIGLVYNNMFKYSTALSFHHKALDIRLKIQPPNYPDLAQSYNSLGSVYNSMNDSSAALSYYERTLDIRQRTLPSNHPDLQDVRKSIEIVKKKLSKDSILIFL